MRKKVIKRTLSFNKAGLNPTTKNGTDMGWVDIGFSLDGSGTFEPMNSQNGWLAISSNKWIKESDCEDATMTPPVDPPPVDTFPSYIPIGSELQVRLKLTSESDYTEWFTFTRMA